MWKVICLYDVTTSKKINDEVKLTYNYTIEQKYLNKVFEKYNDANRYLKCLHEEGRPKSYLIKIN